MYFATYRQPFPIRSEGQKVFLTKARGPIKPGKVNNGSKFVYRHKQVSKVTVHIHSSSRTFFKINSIPEISLKWELENAHPFIKRLFSSNKVPNVLIAGRLKHSSIPQRLGKN